MNWEFACFSIYDRRNSCRVDTLLTERDADIMISTVSDLQVDVMKILASDFDVDNLINEFETMDIPAS